uniref:oocyte-secreted protein 2-like n=1 Tax=Jaculus jaculus TaxID=51337 RepID=UPI001E1B1175|nr:oocyte-secreted protein 2-like [Jaculus jaculus]
MKVSAALEILILLAVLIWPCAENISVKIRCSLDWVRFSVSPSTESRNNLYKRAAELSLGMGCPVSCIQTYLYHFVYPTQGMHAGIKGVSHHTRLAVLFLTEVLCFTPRNSHWDSQTILLECSASRKSVWLVAVCNDDEIKLKPSPFMDNFEARPEELGLLNFHQDVSY